MSEGPFRDRGSLTDASALELLEHGELELVGRMPWSSNATFLVDILGGDEIIQGVYKPERGERPLWDFPSGLYKREVAAYDISAALGWELVPPTITREGPFEIGSLQLFVPADFDQHYYTLVEEPEHHAALQRLCVFDLLINATDRKGGHCLLGQDGHLYAIDNGLSFHAEFKLRTVIWEWAGEAIPAAIVEDVCRLLGNGSIERLGELLDPFEREALRDRARAVTAERRFPIDPTGRRYPWPLV